MWEQLCLEANLVRSTFDDATGTYSITTHLVSRSSLEDQRSRLHKLGSGVPACDVRPPAGITDVPCKAVNISIVLSARELQARDLLKTSDKEADCSYRREQTASEDPDISDDFEDLLLPSDPWRGKEPCDNSQQASHLGVSDYHDVSQQSFPTIYEDCGSATSLDSSGPQRVALLHHNNSCLASSQHDALSTAQGCAHIIETAVQVALCGRSYLNESKLFASGRRTARPLSKLLPSIWCPAYLPGIANRSIFIPTIAHALNSVLERAVHPAGFEWVATSECTGSDLVAKTEYPSDLTGFRMPLQLWRKLCRGVQRARTSQLPPLWESSGQQSEPRGFLDHSPDSYDQWLDETVLLDSNYKYPHTDHEWCEILGEDEKSCLLSDEFLLSDIISADGEPQEVDLDLVDNDDYRATAHFQSTPDTSLDLGHADATCAWQGEHPTSVGRMCSLASQGRLYSAKFTSVKKGAMEEQTAETWREAHACLPIQAGNHRVSRVANAMFDIDGDAIMETGPLNDQHDKDHIWWC